MFGDMRKVAYLDIQLKEIDIQLTEHAESHDLGSLPFFTFRG